MTPPALSVDDLSVSYSQPNGDQAVVVSHVSLELEKGRILGLVGESGCGKSTTALAALGYRPPGGQIISGRSVLNNSVDLLQLSRNKLRSIWGRRIAYVAQDASTALNPAIPIEDQLAEPLGVHLKLRGDAGRKRQLELLEAVGFLDGLRLLSRYPFQLSGGQQQRVAIAIALSCHPDVLILDEPTTGLDVTTQEQISAMLHSLLADTGVATLYVSHNLALLATLADHISVMYAGEIVETGSVKAVVRHPGHPYTQALLAAVPSASRPYALAGIPGRPPVSVVYDSCAFAPRCRYVIEACRAGHVSLHGLGNGHLARCIRAKEVRSTPIRSGVSPRVSPGRAHPLLALIDVRCEYGSRGIPAVKGVSLSVSEGETLAIVGESGSGKSTLLRAIVGLHAPSAGSLRFRGSELPRRARRRAREIRREIQLVFQNPDSSLNPRHTIAEIVGRPISLFRQEVSHSDRRALVAELLQSVNLSTTLLDRYPSELSGGQKQRVALARAFAARPSLLLCDEVTSALDVSVQATVLELISELAAKSGSAVIFVSHDLAVVRTIASRAIVMRDGEVCEEGEIERLFRSPDHPYTQELLKAIPEL
jgi:peptide/nickel transport system ATP-binding protein